MKTIILIAIFVTFSMYGINESFAEVSTNSAFVLEGSGFAVTEDSIEISGIDLVITTLQRSGSSIKSTVEDGVITLNDDDFLATELSSVILRGGNYVRINGIAESPTGDEASISFFGRLVEESKDASVYGFTGRITVNDQSHKVIYTTKLSTLVITPSTPTQTTETVEPKPTVIRITKGASSQGGTATTKAVIDDAASLRYFSTSRITIEPGTSVTFVNDDIVPHRIVSGTGLGTHSSVLQGAVKICSEVSVNLPKGFSVIQPGSDGRDCDFNYDGRIRTGEIGPGQSVTVTFDERGFYRLIDPDYPWMRIDGYVFANLDSLILGTTKNQQGN